MCAKMDRRAVISASTPRSRAMDKYEQLAVVGEGSYGVVLKCRRRDTGQLVAIKKFLETEDDAAVRKMALREIRMLKKLRHDHLVNMIEVYRRRRRFYLVFEYLDHTLLDELEGAPGGLGEDTAKRHLYQLLKGIEYCHQNSIIHRDVKPENVLVSNNGIVKLCDLGFARALAASGEPYTEYVATRWYRAPELLVAEHRYGPEVDIWAVGCLFAEMLTGDPLFPGDSDIDQLALIVKVIGKLAPRHQQVVSRLAGAGGGAGGGAAGRGARAGGIPGAGLSRDLLAACLRTEPRARPTASALLRHKYFVADGFADSFNAELRKKLGKNIDISSPHQPPALTRPGKPRHQWTLNVISAELSRSHPSSTAGESLIDYNYVPNAGENREMSDKKAYSPPLISDTGIGTACGGRSLTRAVHTYQNFPQPNNSYPRTPYIKKVNNKLLIDEELPRARGLVKKTSKKTLPDLSLPYVSGGKGFRTSNSPLKKAKKPQKTIIKNYDPWEFQSNISDVTGQKTPTLPYM